MTFRYIDEKFRWCALTYTTQLQKKPMEQNPLLFVWIIVCGYVHILTKYSSTPGSLRYYNLSEIAPSDMTGELDPSWHRNAFNLSYMKSLKCYGKNLKIQSYYVTRSTLKITKEIKTIIQLATIAIVSWLTALKSYLNENIIEPREKVKHICICIRERCYEFI